MLPGLRFFLAAIMVSLSILVFGLGAAALLRSAHEEVANLPIRRAPSPTIFTQHVDAPQPSLAMLRVDAAPDAGLDQPVPAQIAVVSATATATAALNRPSEAPADQAPQVVSAPEATAVVDQNQSEEAPAAAAEAPSLLGNADTPPAAMPQIAADADPALVGSPQVVLPPEPATTLANPAAAATSWRVASLGNPTLVSEKTVAPKAASADASKKAQARRSAKHRRALARARLLRQQQVQAKPLDPFAPFDTTTAATTTPARR
jgi:hypothetical protein